MKDDRCVIPVGTHPGPFWSIPGRPEFQVCDRHRSQYDERDDDLGPFKWVLVDDPRLVGSSDGS